MITLCPNCATAFRVSEAQLEACAGQVRCGHCRQVFNGRTALIDPAIPAAQVTASAQLPEDNAERSAPVSATGAVIPESVPTTPAGEGTRPDGTPAEGDHPGELSWRHDTEEESATGFAPPQAPTRQESGPTSAEFLRSHELGLESGPTPSSEEEAGREYSAAATGVPFNRDDANPGLASTAPPPLELRQARVAPYPRFTPAELDFGKQSPPRHGWLWWPASVLLLMLLLAQAAFYFRGEIALLYPEAKPWLTQLCAYLDCSIPLPRRAELMSIESSDLQADPNNANIMVLSATLRNRANYQQAHPALELTLTNAEDQSVARRVLNARDYLPRDAAIDLGFPPGIEVPIKVFIETAGLKATGYRLYLFYP